MKFSDENLYTFLGPQRRQYQSQRCIEDGFMTNYKKKKTKNKNKKTTGHQWIGKVAMKRKVGFCPSVDLK